MASGGARLLERTQNINMRVKPEFKVILSEMAKKRGFKSATQYIEHLVMVDHLSLTSEEQKEEK